MWPFSELSLAVATRISDWANLALIGSLLAGVLSTFVIVKMGNIKESHWDRERDQSKERIARLNNETEHLKADNLALQTVLLPRHVGLIGLDEPPKALEWFSGFEALEGTEISIQVAPDTEAQNLANEIAIVLSKFGWKPQFVDEKRSRFASFRISDGVNVSYPIGKPWTAEEPNQPWFAWSNAAEALANALTKAGLGIGDKRVSRYGFLNNDPNAPPGLMPSFDPPLTGVYLQIGSRPVAATVEWIRQGRPDPAGNLPAPATSKPNTQK